MIEEPKRGLAIHCRHDTLIEYCYDYDKRVEVICNIKPKHELPTRLRLFRILPPEALTDLPKKLQEAYGKCEKAHNEVEEAFAEDGANKWYKALTKLRYALCEWMGAYARWPASQRKAFHTKWCNCSECYGEEIVFPKEVEPNGPGA